MSSSLKNEGTTEAPAFSYEYHSEEEGNSSAQDDPTLNSDSSEGNLASNHVRFHRKKLKLRQKRNPVSKFVNPSFDSDLEDHKSTSSDDSSSESPDHSSSTSSSEHSEKSGLRGHLQRSTQTNRLNLRLVPVLKYVLGKMVRFSSKYHKEISVIFFLIASALSLVKKGPAKIQTASSPRPFFPPAASHYLQDNYNGDYVDLARNIIPFVPTFVFYYAPWDSESLDARNEFLNVAHYFHNTEPGLVKFVSVNCWYVNGQCRQNYKSMSHFPIFVMHVTSPTGVIYSGPIRSQLMIRFIHLALKPMTRLDTEDNFWNFRSQHDVLLLSYFNFTDAIASDAYETYRQVALRHLEFDSFGQVGFGVILQPELAEKYFLSSSASTISLVLFNEIHTAKWTSGFQENEENTKGGKGPVIQIIEWLTERTKKLPITWLYSIRNGFANRPVAMAPVDLSKEIMNGPVFLLVTKRYYPSSYSPFYNQVKEVALDYFNCNQSGNVTKLRRTLHKLNSDWMKLWKSIGDICTNLKSATFNCKMLLPQLEHWKAKKVLYVKNSISNFENISSQLNFTGLSCASQRQFRFYAVDPVDIPHFVELAFGLKQYEFRPPTSGTEMNSSGRSRSSQAGNDPMAFIIDAQNEIMMPFTSFNISELARTIHSFTKETENGCASPSHFIVEGDRRNESKENVSVTKERQLVQKFNSAEFLEYLNVMNSTNMVTDVSSAPASSSEPTSLFLMYTAKFCGFCNVVLTQFLSLGKFLEHYDVNITLGKIDTYSNSLPANLNPETIPSFVLYSTAQQRNSSTSVTGIDSRAFPANEEITAKTLLRFLLSELSPATRVGLSLNATARKCSNAEPFRRADCLYANKLSVANQIQSVLEKLSTDLGLAARKEIVDHEGSLADNEIEMLQVGRPITLWETELLDHLRSVKLVLDVA